ncbi:molybdopterin cofactor-binding domain-containing protein [Nocardia aurea]|uniref:Molybdopterin cofactor-binding domain-containing protein n=1 Tax=Nocardia aurea TaxID=2144174 RepID=A0ABV3FTL7_9NOCA
MLIDTPSRADTWRPPRNPSHRNTTASRRWPRFGWSRRTREPGSTREGRWLVGYGVAGVSYPFYQVPCQARASVRGDGSAYVRSAATDIGTGTYTVMTQLAAELLGFDIGRVRFDLADSDTPCAPQAGGSGLTGSPGNAVHAACRRLIQEFLEVGLVGVAAAIGNAVFHATGRRIRSLPITIDQLLL